MDDNIEAVALADCQKLLRDLTLAKAVFQMRSVQAALSLPPKTPGTPSDTPAPSPRPAGPCP
jgi:hypothetical protein